MKELIANNNDAGKRLDAFLEKILTAPKSDIYKWIRKKRVKINKKAVSDIAYRIKEGDEFSLYINDEFFRENTPLKKADLSLLKIVYEDENIVIMDKPKGISSQPDISKEVSLSDLLKTYLFERGEFDPKAEHSFTPALCHRIDKNTSGLVIGAKNASALKIMNEKIREKAVRKFYILSVENPPKEKKGTISGYITKDEKTNKVTFSKTETKGSKKAETLYEVLPDGRISAELKTGRSHQIRASFSYIGCPLCGDVKYGAKKTKDKSYQDLRAARIEFKNEGDWGILEYLKGKTIEAD